MTQAHELVNVNGRQLTEREMLLQTNESHRKLNGDLRIENKLLREIAEEMYDVMSNIDFASQNIFKYQDMHWQKWEAVIAKRPVQLKLF